MDEALVSKARVLLKKLRSGAQFGNIQLKDVKEALCDGDFLTAEGLLTANDNGSILLHLAAQTKVVAVLPLVLEEYKRLKVFSAAMLKLNNKNKNPLHVAIAASRYESVVLLFKECVELCPEALQPEDSGWTLLHSAVQSPENLNIVKYLLSHERCKPMLLSLGKDGQKESVLPLDLARKQLDKYEAYLRQAESSSRREDYSVRVDPKKKVVEKCKDLLSLVEQLTVEMKVDEAKRLAKEQAQRELLERTQKIESELHELLLASNWETVVDKYWLSEKEEIRKITVRYIGERHTVDDVCDLQLPNLTGSMVQVLLSCLDLSEDDTALKGAMKVLKECTTTEENNLLIFSVEECRVDDKIVRLLSSLDAEIQILCAGILLNILNHRPHCFESPAEDSEMIHALLLVRHFSPSEEAKSLSNEVLLSLGVKRKQPDPGAWTVRHVSFWMENNEELDQRAEFSKSFREADIDGLHLLELTSAEMTGLGVKYVSHQRKIASLIDGLRRMNMRSIVGHKDIFLSYAHININFARRLKFLLNEANYTVWIDEAGIRAGHKWRNEIADGIQSCSVFLFVMTPRSANSEYCQDEIALAEEYHRPIMTVRLQAVSEMDPGLKLIIQRRQWIDFVEEAEFEASKAKLVEALRSTMGQGSGPELGEEEEPAEDLHHSPDRPMKYPDSETKASCNLPLSEVVPELITKDYLEQELKRVRVEFSEELGQLREEVKQLRAVVDQLMRLHNSQSPQAHRD